MVICRQNLSLQQGGLIGYEDEVSRIEGYRACRLIIENLDEVSFRALGVLALVHVRRILQIDS